MALLWAGGNCLCLKAYGEASTSHAGFQLANQPAWVSVSGAMVPAEWTLPGISPLDSLSRAQGVKPECCRHRSSSASGGGEAPWPALEEPWQQR